MSGHPACLDGLSGDRRSERVKYGLCQVELQVVPELALLRALLRDGAALLRDDRDAEPISPLQVALHSLDLCGAPGDSQRRSDSGRSGAALRQRSPASNPAPSHSTAAHRLPKSRTASRNASALRRCTQASTHSVTRRCAPKATASIETA